MNKIVIATLAAVIFVALLLNFFASRPVKMSEHPVQVQMDPATVVAQSAPVSKQATPVVADMSLPMPLGLKGDPVKGGEFFMKTCATCHGKNGDGDGPRAYFITPPPRNFLLETSRQRLNRPTLFEAVTNGRIGTNMPAWGKVLNNQEVANVAEFVFQHFIISPQGSKGKQE